MFVKSTNAAAALAASGAIFMPPKDLNINDPASIKSVASTVAHGLMTYYTGNVTKTPETIAVFPQPYYWWQAGAAWGAMLDYVHYTGDTSYNDVITEALLSQVGPTFDYMSPLHFGSEGNDDQAFWSFAVLAAAEQNFPQPNEAIPSWLDLASNIWNTMVPRWNATHCGGGFTWQIFASNPNGLDYKNSVSNGGFFQLSARLYRATGNQTYFDWAKKVYEWSEAIGFVDKDFNVYDGADSKDNCSKVNPVSFSYSQGIYMYGAAVLYNATNGDPVWGARTEGLLKATQSYFNPFANATNIMYEHACEQVNVCNNDMKSFKGYLSRFMWSTTQMMPSTLPQVQSWLNVSAVAAATTCSGGDSGTACGQKWYTGGFDGSVGLGQQMTVLETVQGLLVGQTPPPFRGDEIKVVRGTPATTPSAANPAPTKRANSSGAISVNWVLTVLSLGAGIFTWNLA